MSHTWLTRLRRWIAAFFGHNPQAPKQRPRLLKSWTSYWGVLNLIDRNTPEAVENATYQFVPAYKWRGFHLLLTCDRYRPARNPQGSDRGPGHWGLRQGTLVHGHPNPSHRLSLSVVREVNGTNLVQNRIYFSYPVDFVGANGLLAGQDYYARRFAAELAQRLLASHYEKINWEQQIHSIAASIGTNHEILMQEPQ